MANRSPATLSPSPRKPLATEFARWSKFHPGCKLVAFNQDPALSDYMGKRGIRVAGMDYLEQPFLAGTPSSDTHLVWVLFSGRLECDSGAGFKPMKPGDVAICPATHPHWIRLASPKASGLWLHFNPTPRWERLGSVQPGIYPDLGLGHLRGLAEAYLVGSPLQGAADISAKIHAFELIIFSIEQALDQITGGKRHAFKTKIKNLEATIQDNLKADWTVAALAAGLNLSPSYLHKAALAHLGIKPMGLVTRLRMNHAMSRLLQTNMTLADIAEEVGFASPFAFSAAFKREVGRSPSQFRAAGFASPSGTGG
jgi:AraC-like DNA-binding protein